MSTKQIEIAAKDILVPVIEESGYEVVEIKYVNRNKTNYLEIYIYKKGGISLDDCVIVNDLLDPVLEEHDITNGVSYSLNISSPGLDRPIVSLDDLRRSLDTEVEAILKPINKKKIKHVGVLIFYSDDEIKIEKNGQIISIDRNVIMMLRPYVNMNKLK